MPDKKHVIIGTGPAAVNAVEKIRSFNREDGITMISREDTFPYSPAGLPYLLAGRTKEQDFRLREKDFFSDNNIEFLGGREVVSIQPDKKQVALTGGETVGYDTLLIASGASPAPLPVAGASEEDVLHFHTLADCIKLAGLLKPDTEVAVLGAGMIAMELAMALVERGNKVKIIGRGRPLRAYFEEQAGGYISDIFTQHGVEINTGKAISGIRKTGGGIEVDCGEGGVFKADVLVSCLGVQPRLSLVEGSGLKTGRGIIVNDRMETSVPGIYAVGDVAESAAFFGGKPGISAILPSAISQGKVAGANMAGQEAVYPGWISMNQIRFFGSTACSIGQSVPEDGAEVMEEKDDTARYFKRLVFKDNRLVGVMLVNVPADPGTVRYVIEKKLDTSAVKEVLFRETLDTSRLLMLEHERSIS